MSPASLPIPDDLVDELLAESNDIESRAVAEAERASLSTPAMPHSFAASAPSTSTPAPSSPTTSSTPSPQTWNGNSRPSMSGWLSSNPTMTLLTTPSPRMCWRRSVSAWTRTYQRPTGRRSFSCSCAGLRSTPQLPDRGRKQVRVVIDYRFPPRARLARASLRVTATISAALSPPEPEPPHHRPHPAPTAAAGLSQFQFPQPDRCGEDIPKARVTLRSVAPTLPFAVTRFDGLASRSAIGNLALRVRPRISGWASCLNFYFLYKESAAAWLRVLPRRRRPLRRPVRHCRATGRDTDVRRTWVALSPVRPTRAPRGAFASR